MTPLKQRILDIVQRAGVDGIPAEDLFAIVYDGALPRYHGSHADWARKREALASVSPEDAADNATVAAHPGSVNARRLSRACPVASPGS